MIANKIHHYKIIEKLGEGGSPCKTTNKLTTMDWIPVFTACPTFGGGMTLVAYIKVCFIPAEVGI